MKKIILERMVDLGSTEWISIYNIPASGDAFANLKQITMAAILREYPDCTLIVVGSEDRIRIENCTEDNLDDTDGAILIATNGIFEKIGEITPRYATFDNGDMTIYIDITLQLN